MSDEVIKGGKVQFFGNKDNKPCGVQIVGKDDLGNMGWINFEVFSCDDLGLSRGGASRTCGSILANFDPEEVVNAIVRGIKKCGCPIKVKG